MQRMNEAASWYVRQNMPRSDGGEAVAQPRRAEVESRPLWGRSIAPFPAAKIERREGRAPSSSAAHRSALARWTAVMSHFSQGLVVIDWPGRQRRCAELGAAFYAIRRRARLDRAQGVRAVKPWPRRAMGRIAGRRLVQRLVAIRRTRCARKALSPGRACDDAWLGERQNTPQIGLLPLNCTLTKGQG